MGKVGIPGISSALGIVAARSDWHTEIPDSLQNSRQNMPDLIIAAAEHRVAQS
jgi:hypothetical protein